MCPSVRGRDRSAAGGSGRSPINSCSPPVRHNRPALINGTSARIRARLGRGGKWCAAPCSPPVMDGAVARLIRRGGS